MREKAKKVMELDPGPPEAASLGGLGKENRLRCSAHSTSPSASTPGKELAQLALGRPSCSRATLSPSKRPDLQLV